MAGDPPVLALVPGRRGGRKKFTLVDERATLVWLAPRVALVWHASAYVPLAISRSFARHASCFRAGHMLRGLLLLCVPSFVLACGSEAPNEAPASSNNAPKAESTTKPLDACTLPSPCSWPLSSGKPSEADGPRCVVSELANGRALSVDTLLVGDGPSTGCEVHQELHFYATATTAYSIWRKKCGTTEERRTKRCTMLTRDAYATCLAKLDATRTSSEGIGCSLPSEWMTDCTEVTTPACP